MMPLFDSIAPISNAGNSVEYITDYPDLCDACQSMIKNAATFVSELPDEYASDEEGPSMWVYDNGLLCGGHYCEIAEAERERMQTLRRMYPEDMISGEATFADYAEHGTTKFWLAQERDGTLLRDQEWTAGKYFDYLLVAESLALNPYMDLQRIAETFEAERSVLQTDFHTAGYYTKSPVKKSGTYRYYGDPVLYVFATPPHNPNPQEWI